MFNFLLFQTLKDISIKGKLLDRKGGACIDSRLYKKGDSFWCFRGVHVDGFDFISDVLEKGCPLVIYEFNLEKDKKIDVFVEKYPHVIFIGVSDIISSIQKIAHEHYKRWIPERTLIGITGSNGKTTTKEILGKLLKDLFPSKVATSDGNQNNHIGLPLNILNLKEEEKIAVIEYGTSHPGEIKKLCEIACPTSGIITNIQQAHLEFFKSLEEIAKEKQTLYDFSTKKYLDKSIFVVCGDDPFLGKLLGKNLVKVGKKKGEIKIEIELNKLVFVKENISIKNIFIFEPHILLNLAISLTLAFKLFPDKKDALIKGAENLRLSQKNRSQWIEDGGNKFYLDAYNANPSSMKVSLDSFIFYLKANKISLNDCLFILGDMNELGKESEKMHEEIGVYLHSLKVKNAIFVGRSASFFQRGFKGGSTFLSPQEVKDNWQDYCKSFFFLFFKGFSFFTARVSNRYKERLGKI